jgi:hypothetical protein
VDGELEGLSLLLEFGQLPIDDAVKLYQQYTAKIGFIADVPWIVGDPRPGVAAPGPEPQPGPLSNS